MSCVTRQVDFEDFLPEVPYWPAKLGKCLVDPKIFSLSGIQTILA